MFWEKNKDLIILAFFWALASSIILFILNLETNDRVEVWAIATLVFITLYYAIQTYKLVEEGKKRSLIDYWERRITQFYKPFIDKLDVLKITMRQQSSTGQDIIETIDDLRSYFLEKKYMISLKTSQQIESLQGIFWDALVGMEGVSMEDFKLREDEIRVIIKKEWDDIENIIRKFYGY